MSSCAFADMLKCVAHLGTTCRYLKAKTTFQTKSWLLSGKSGIVLFYKIVDLINWTLNSFFKISIICFMLYTKNQRSTEGTDVLFYSCSVLLESMLELKSFASYLLSMTSANHTAFRKNICLLCKWGIGRETVIFQLFLTVSSREQALW